MAGWLVRHHQPVRAFGPSGAPRLTHFNTVKPGPTSRFLLREGALRSLRTRRGISLRSLAAELAISPSLLSGIENGRTRVSRAFADHAAALLDCPVDDLLAPVQAASAQSPTAVTNHHWRTYEPLTFDAPLTAALSTFLEFGYHGASTREIASRAGLSVPGLYHYYPTKQHMLVAIMQYVMDDILSRSRAACAQGKTPAERFALMVESVALFHAARRELAFVGSSELRSLEPEALARNRQARRLHRQLLDDETKAAVACGEFRTHDPLAASRAVVGLCVSLPLWFKNDGTSTPQQVATQYVEYALRIAGYTKNPATLIKRLKVGSTPPA